MKDVVIGILSFLLVVFYLRGNANDSAVNTVMFTKQAIQNNHCTRIRKRNTALTASEVAGFPRDSFITALQAMDFIERKFPNQSFNHYAVNIGARDGIGDGPNVDPIYELFSKRNYSGTLIEVDPIFENSLKTNFPRQNVYIEGATPHTIIKRMQAWNVPRNLAVLKVDIDSFDCPLLSQILKGNYRPSLLVMEINEKIPPPYRFSTNFHTDFAPGPGHLYGCSVSYMDDLVSQYGYVLLQIDHNNAMFIKIEYCSVFPSSFNPFELYEREYLSRKDRMKKFPWNRKVEHWLGIGSDLNDGRVVAALGRRIFDDLLTMQQFKNRKDVTFAFEFDVHEQILVG